MALTPFVSASVKARSGHYNASMSLAYDRLVQFLEAEMRMSHIYQPVMLEVLFTHGGTASAHDIAAAIPSHDESQIDYYERIVHGMPGKVLRSRGLVRREGKSYSLAVDLSELSDDERADVVLRCHAAVESYKARRGATIWAHRRGGLGRIPGKDIYETLKRAGQRCELCGVPAKERWLAVDHIVPRKHGGSDDPSNLQALCWLCNAHKGAGDATDFRTVHESYAARERDCPFCEFGDRKLIGENPLAILIADSFPVTEGHMLAIPRRHVADYFELRQPERNAIQRLLEAGRTHLRQSYQDVVGFNVGVNAGEAAGQTIFHCHVHLIPRRAGDVENPRGGVRGVVPKKQDYHA
jgi:ATP adenylyltransferase